MRPHPHLNSSAATKLVSGESRVTDPKPNLENHRLFKVLNITRMAAANIAQNASPTTENMIAGMLPFESVRDHLDRPRIRNR